MAKFFVGDFATSKSPNTSSGDVRICGIHNTDYLIETIEDFSLSYVDQTHFDKDYKLKIEPRFDSHVKKTALPFAPWRITYR